MTMIVADGDLTVPVDAVLAVGIVTTATASVVLAAHGVERDVVLTHASSSARSGIATIDLEDRAWAKAQALFVTPLRAAFHLPPSVGSISPRSNLVEESTCGVPLISACYRRTGRLQPDPLILT